MTITLSDSDFIISDVKVEHVTPSFYTEGLNFVGNAMGRGLHRLNIECDIHFANVNDIRAFQALMLTVQGRAKTFNLSLQDETDGKGYFNPLSIEARAQLGSSLSIGNTSAIFTGSTSNVVPGAMFQFTNNSKIYTVISKNGSRVEFFPPVRTEHLVSEAINFKPVPLVRLTEDKFRVHYEVGSSITIKMMEAL